TRKSEWYEFLNMQGYLYLRQGKPKEAEEQFNRAIALEKSPEPSQYEANLNLGTSRSLQGDSTCARTHWTRGLSLLERQQDGRLDNSRRLSRALFSVAVGKVHKGIEEMGAVLNSHPSPSKHEVGEALIDAELISRSKVNYPRIDEAIQLLKKAIGNESVKQGH